MAALHFEKRGKNILGTSKKINHRVGSFPQMCCFRYQARCSLDSRNERFQAEKNTASEKPARSGFESMLRVIDADPEKAT